MKLTVIIYLPWYHCIPVIFFPSCITQKEKFWRIIVVIIFHPIKINEDAKHYKKYHKSGAYLKSYDSFV